MPFPNFEEMNVISEEAKSERQLQLGAKLITLIPSHITDKLPAIGDVRMQIVQQIITATVYPDLFQRKNTHERITNAICDFARGYITALIVTSIMGVYTETPHPFEQSCIHPRSPFFSSWLQEQLYWGTPTFAGFGHALLMTERRLPFSSITLETFQEEPTTQELQALRLATNSEVVSLGSYMRGAIFKLESYPFGSGIRWWNSQHKKLPMSSTILTKEHIKEACYLLHHVRSDDGPLSVAIRRFDLAANRNDERDRLIDLAIATESLFLTENERDNQTYRLKLRGARCVYPDAERPAKASWLNYVYKLRGKIVHGDRLKAKEKSSVEDNSKKFADFVRMSIRKCARLVDRGGDNIPALLDNALLGFPDEVNIITQLDCPNLPVDQISEQDIFNRSMQMRL